MRVEFNKDKNAQKIKQRFWKGKANPLPHKKNHSVENFTITVE
jgi:hypothetical protein